MHLLSLKWSFISVNIWWIRHVWITKYINRWPVLYRKRWYMVCVTLWLKIWFMPCVTNGIIVWLKASVSRYFWSCNLGYLMHETSKWSMNFLEERCILFVIKFFCHFFSRWVFIIAESNSWVLIPFLQHLFLILLFMWNCGCQLISIFSSGQIHWKYNGSVP